MARNSTGMRPGITLEAAARTHARNKVEEFGKLPEDFDELEFLLMEAFKVGRQFGLAEGMEKACMYILDGIADGIEATKEKLLRTVNDE